MTAKHPDAERWNARYQDEAEAWLERQPRGLLLQNMALLPETGLVLEAASGVAANGLYLAKHGFRVFALDVSETALALAIRRARRLGVTLSAAVVDLAAIWLPEAHFDVILNFYFLQRPALSIYGRALKPGGLLFFETFLRREGSSCRLEHYLEPGELRCAYQGWDMLYWAEEPRASPEIGQSRMVEKLIARKPSPRAESAQAPRVVNRRL